MVDASGEKFTTDLDVKGWRATDERQEIRDALLPGHYLIVQPNTGVKSWQVRYRASGKQRRMTLGKYPLMSLAEARKRAREVKLGAQAGGDPAAEVKIAKVEKPNDTVSDALNDYEKRKLKSLKSGELVKRELDRFARKKWGERRLTSLSRRDVQDLIDDIADSGRAVTANRVLSYIKAFLNWCCDRALLEVSPAERVKKPAKETARARVLSDDEVRWFWIACDREGYPLGHMAQLLLLTGQRLNEIARLTEVEIDGESLNFPPSRTKNKQAHRLPLPEAIVDFVDSIPRVPNPSGYIFTTNGKSPVQGFDKMRRRLATMLLEQAEKERGVPVVVPHWTFHDLRRTCSTGMARDGVDTVLNDFILNHISGIRSGVGLMVYDKYNRIDPMRAALESWELRIRGILGNNS